MSSYVTSDYTILAIVAGMKKYKMTSTREQKTIAEALRIINEQTTWKKWSKSGNLPFDENKHQKVDWKLNRAFSDEEIWQSCKCWLYQIGNERGVSFDFITIIAGVRLLKKNIEQEHVTNGTWKRKVYFGKPHFLSQNTEDGTWYDIHKTIKWDLAA